MTHRLDLILFGLVSCTAMGSIAIIYTEARNFFTSNQYVSTQVTELATSASNQAGSELVQNFLQGNDAAGVTAAGRMALTRPFAYSEYNLEPFDQLAGEAATTAGAIYLIVSLPRASLPQASVKEFFLLRRSDPVQIFVFFFTPIWTGVYSSVRTGLTLGSDIFLTIVANLGWYFWISLHYSSVTPL